MNMRRHLFEALTLIIVAVVIASISNALASRDRKLSASGSYANATIVPGAQQAPTTATEVDPPPSGPVQESLAESQEDAASEPVTTDPAAVAMAAPSAPAGKPAKPLFSKEDVLKRFPPKPDEPLIEISGDDVMWLYAAGTRFLDARRTSVYEAGHIAGALNFAVWEGDVDEKVARLVEDGTDPEMPIVVYCSGGNCEDSHMLAQKLWGMFFNNVLVYRDGYPDWTRRGGLVKKGSEP